MDIQALDSRQLATLESRLFEEFTELDQLIAAKQEKLRNIEAMLTHVATLRKQKEDGGRYVDEEEEIVEDPRPVTPPVYSEDRISPPSFEESSWVSGPFEIRKSPSGEVDTVTCDLGHHFLLVERDNAGTTACWRIQEKHLLPADCLRLLSPESMDSSP